MEINMKVESLKFKEESTTEDNGRVYYSGNDYYGQQASPTVSYATLEKDYWLLDGKKTLLPQNNFAIQPLISDSMTDENGLFVVQPSITISATGSGLTYDLIGLTFTFDELDKDYPTEIHVDRYLNDSLLGTQIYTNEKVFTILDEGISGFNKVVIRFVKMNKPYRRLRITKMMLGIMQQYTDENLIECKQTWLVDLLSREITDATFKMTIDNRSLNYNADNPNSINRYFQERQPLEIKYFYETSENVYELVKGGTLYLTGTPTTEEFEATFEAKGSLYFKTSEFRKGIYNANGISYYDLLQSVFTEANITNYSIDESLKNLSTSVPLPILPTKELIQLICNATNTVCIEDRDAKMWIKPFDLDVKNYYLDLKNQMEYPKTETLPKLRNINVKMCYPSLAVLETSDTEEIFSGKFNLTKAETLKIDYSTAPATDIEVNVTNGTITDATYYAYSCELLVTPTDTTQPVDIKINGVPIELNESTYTLNVNVEGEDCDIDNPLIETEENARLVAEHFKNYLIKRNSYTVEYRGEPCFDTTDIIELQTQFSERVNAMITKNEIKYNGALEGKMEMKGLV